MPTPVLVTCKLLPEVGLSEDVVMNTFAVDLATGDDSSDVAGFFIDFYQEISEVLSPSLAEAPVDAIEVYMAEITLATGDLGPAGLVAAGPLGTLAATPLPQEVAVALSFKNDSFTGDPARARGRVFIGPLGTNTVVVDGSDVARVATEVQDMFALAAVNLASALSTIGSPWCIWSRSNAALLAVSSGWIDNEFDTIRSRGRDATSRTLWNI